VALPLAIIAAPIGAFTLARWWTERRRWGASASLWFSYVFAAAVDAAVYIAFDLPEPGFPAHAGWAASAFLGAYNSLLVVGLWALAYLMPAAARTAREQAAEREALRRAAERARLRATLEPHFVLNTLNTIAGLVHDDPDQARERIGDLGDLLRDAVRLADSERHALDDEVRWLERYTRILVARHADRLEVRWDIDPATRGAQVPVLALQPLVENAIQHGALMRPGGGHVAIATRATGDRLSCTISDDGPGFPAELRPGAQGLALTRRRLAAEWPGAALDVASGAAGTRIAITWPRSDA
jgi:LytS/YehU family sensor histidine kinase